MNLTDIAAPGIGLARRVGRRVDLYRRIARPDYLGVVLRQRLTAGMGPAPGADRALALDEAIAWLYRSMDAGEADGSRCFRFQTGWSACYPEVTGYNLYTLFDHAAQTGRRESFDRAVRMARWELTVQLDSGAFPGGYVDGAMKPVVFNTGQVLQGLVRAWRETGDGDFLDAAKRAADWLVSVQDADGAWRRFCYLDSFRVTDTRIAYPLAELAAATGDERLRDAAARSLRHVMGLQHANGWFPRCDNTVEGIAHPVTHTLAYTIEGLVQGGRLVGDAEAVEAGRRAADALLRRFEIDRVLYGRYDERWRPTVDWSCLTGCAQMSLCWSLLAAESRDPWYVNAVLRMNDFLCGCQDVRIRHPGIRGAMAGSHPIGGGYQPFAYPSWATKYFCDALLAEQRLSGAS